MDHKAAISINGFFQQAELDGKKKKKSISMHCYTPHFANDQKRKANSNFNIYSSYADQKGKLRKSLLAKELE